MNKTTNQINPEINWCTIHGKICLKFTFKGNLTSDEAFNAVERWNEFLYPITDRKTILIWDCLEMTGYDSLARAVWQRSLKNLVDKIDCIWLVSNSLIIQSGAKIMSIFASYDINVANSIDEIPFEKF